MRRLLLAAAAALPLTACGERPPLALNVPAELLHCAGRPAVPPRKGRTQRDVAGFVSDLSDAHAECEGKLGEVRTLVEGVR